jgi:hypothetical protein
MLEETDCWEMADRSLMAIQADEKTCSGKLKKKREEPCLPEDLRQHQESSVSENRKVSRVTLEKMEMCAQVTIRRSKPTALQAAFFNGRDYICL